MTDLFDDTFVNKYKLALLKKSLVGYELIGYEPINWDVIRYIGFYYESCIILHKCSKSEFLDFLEIHHPKNELTKKLHLTLKQYPEKSTIDAPVENDEPISLFINELIENAKNKKASDIHLEANDNEYTIRFRCDGLLQIITKIPKHLALRVITKIKIMAQLNIAERRLPQDGRIKYNIDLRVSTCPTLNGEKIVLRLLYNSSFNMDLNHLGLTKSQLNIVYKSLALPQGIIIVTGPTGSGKTSTLYAALNFLNVENKNIITIENPIELTITGINQINCHDEIGLNFAAILRAILRQDPDIIMVGEIRDKQTASIALQASQTGHLILTTLHTNNAASVFKRLQTLGIDKSYLSESIILVIAQRLLRILCKKCKEPDPENVGTWYAVGCKHCSHGYTGRIGIFECLAKSTPQYHSLYDQATRLLNEGITSKVEIIRALGDET